MIVAFATEGPGSGTGRFVSRHGEALNENQHPAPGRRGDGGTEPVRLRTPADDREGSWRRGSGVDELGLFQGRQLSMRFSRFVVRWSRATSPLARGTEEPQVLASAWRLGYRPRRRALEGCDRPGRTW